MFSVFNESNVQNFKESGVHSEVLKSLHQFISVWCRDLLPYTTVAEGKKGLLKTRSEFLQRCIVECTDAERTGFWCRHFPVEQEHMAEPPSLCTSWQSTLRFQPKTFISSKSWRSLSITCFYYLVLSFPLCMLVNQLHVQDPLWTELCHTS